jgi:hypothetical protein
MSLIGRNGKSEDQLRREQYRRQEEQLNLQADVSEDVDTDYVESMMESELQPATASMLGNLLSRDWILSKMSEAEVHEERWLARTIVDAVESMHPPEDSIWQGSVRRYAFDDPKQQLEPLNSAQKEEIFQFVQGHIARVARSRDGFQQETFKKQIRKSERENRTEEDDGGWL